MAKRRAFPMLLTNRTEVPVPADLALSPDLLGVDAAQRIVVRTPDGPRALTECHGAVATAVPNGELAVCPGCDPDSNPYVDAYFARDAQVLFEFVPLSPAEVNAVKQGWKIDATPTMGALRAALAAVELAPVPTVAEIAGRDAELLNGDPNPDFISWDPADPKVVAEHARLLRNAKVNQWRDSQRLQAAIDRRSATYALLRAAKTPRTTADVAGPVDALAGVTSDADAGL